MENTVAKSPDKNDIAVMLKVTEMCKELLNNKDVKVTVEKLGTISICLEQDINVQIKIEKI